MKRPLRDVLVDLADKVGAQGHFGHATDCPTCVLTTELRAAAASLDIAAADHLPAWTYEVTIPGMYLILQPEGEGFRSSVVRVISGNSAVPIYGPIPARPAAPARPEPVVDVKPGRRWRTICSAGRVHAEFAVADKDSVKRRLREVVDADDNIGTCGPHRVEYSDDGGQLWRPEHFDTQRFDHVQRLGSRFPR